MNRRMGGVAIAVALLLCAAQGAHAAPIIFGAALDGATEDPPVVTDGRGSTVVTIDPVAHTMRVFFEFSDLVSPTIAAHIHATTALPFQGNTGVATQVPTFPDTPLGVTSGVYDRTFDMTLDSSYNPDFLAANGGTAASAELALFTAIQTGRAYLNIHTDLNRGGEIRGFLRPVPEPTTVALGAMGMVALAGYGWRRRSRRAALA
jgi:MYXO-CTERM domain-containing protein